MRVHLLWSIVSVLNITIYSMEKNNNCVIVPAEVITKELWFGCQKEPDKIKINLNNGIRKELILPAQSLEWFRGIFFRLPPDTLKVINPSITTTAIEPQSSTTQDFRIKLDAHCTNELFEGVNSYNHGLRVCKYNEGAAHAAYKFFLLEKSSYLSEIKITENPIICRFKQSCIIEDKHVLLQEKEAYMGLHLSMRVTE
jgi:hypothetical protein